MTAYQKFEQLLKDHYGLTPIDFDVETEDDYCSLAGSDTPESVVAWLGRKYELNDREEVLA
jgi:hypothetical protein